MESVEDTKEDCEEILKPEILHEADDGAFDDICETVIDDEEEEDIKENDIPWNLIESYFENKHLIKWGYQKNLNIE